MIMLEVSDIDLHYGAAQALRGISLKAEAGKVTCVLGRNGVGKTSLLRAIVGQHPVSKGRILLDGDRHHRALDGVTCTQRHWFCTARPGDLPFAYR